MATYLQVYRLLFGLAPDQHREFIRSLRHKRSTSLGNLNDMLNPPPDLAKGLIYQILRENPKLLFDPEVMDVIGHLTGTTGSPTDLDPKEVADVMKVVKTCEIYIQKSAFIQTRMYG